MQELFSGLQIARSPRVKITRLISISVLLSVPSSSGEAGGSSKNWYPNPNFQKKLDELTGSRLIPNNKLKLLPDGINAHSQKIANIKEADLVLLKIYALRNDVAGNDMVSKFSEKAQEGTPVFIQHDYLGSGDWGTLFALPSKRRRRLPAHLNPLRKAGVNVAPATVPQKVLDLFLPRDHKKSLITWNKGGAVRAVLGGLNLDDESAFGGHQGKIVRRLGIPGQRDTDVEVVGPATEQIIADYVLSARQNRAHTRKLKAALDRLRQDSSAFASAGKATVRFISEPIRKLGQSRKIQAALIAMLEEVPSGETVTLTSGYFLPTRAVDKAIRAAIKRNVRFRFLINPPSVPRFTIKMVSTACQAYLRSLLSKVPEDSVRVFVWHGEKPGGKLGALHQKVVLLGRSGPVGVMSANIDPMSLEQSAEYALFTDDKEFKHECEEMIETDLGHPGVKEVRLKDLLSVHPLRRLYERAVWRLLGPVL